MAGAQLMTPSYAAAGDFGHDPSQIVKPDRCPFDKWLSVRQALTRFPRAAFDYVWLIDPPAVDPALLRGLTLIWQDGPDRLYHVDDRTQPPQR